jgi:hypothetical protein
MWRFAAMELSDKGGSKMHRVVASAPLAAILAGGLGGCSSLDYFKSAPPIVQVQLESKPPGADAKTSLGPGCKTPCSVSVPAPDTGFSVSYELPKFRPLTVQVQVIHNPGDLAAPDATVTDPNPVYAELQPAGAPPKSIRKRARTKKPKIAAVPVPAESAFPDPNIAPAPAALSR